MNTIETRLEEMLALANAATAGPWEFEQLPGAQLETLCCPEKDDYDRPIPVLDYPNWFGSAQLQKNWNFIAAARTGWPATVQALRLALGQLNSMRNLSRFPDEDEVPDQAVAGTISAIAKILTEGKE